MLNKVMTYLDLDGTMRHFENGLLHSKTGPAVVYSNGFKAWYHKGFLTKAIDQDGFILSPNFGFDFPDGVHYRRRDFTETYVKDCRYHNDNGPAYIDHGGGIRIWYQNGKEIKREKFQPYDFQLIFQESGKETENKEAEIKDDYNEDGTIDDYENGVLVRKHGPDGSIMFFDKNHLCTKKQHPDGNIYELDNDGYWNITFPKKQIPKISFDVDGNIQRFTAIIDQDTYTVQVTPNTVEYRKNNQLHRDYDLPARKTKTTWEYYTNDKLIGQEPTLDPPIKQHLVNSAVLKSNIKNMPDIEQEFIDQFALDALSAELEGFYVIQQFNKVLHNNLDFNEWLKLDPKNKWIDACIRQIVEFLAADSNEQRLTKILDIFIASPAFWQKYASTVMVASKHPFVQRFYNKAIKENYSNDFKAKLLTFLL